MPASPPVYGYSTEAAFGGLNFSDPVVITAPPGETNRLFIVEQDGRVAVITNLLTPTRTVFLDIVSRVSGGVPNDERGLLGMAFHPGYATNRYFYVYYSTTTNGSPHQRLSRFEASPTNPDQALPLSEVPLLTMADDAGNHNGGDIHFGADGYLYLSLGDEGGGNDQYNNSQIIDKDFWAGIIRIDVDLRTENLEPNPHPAIGAGTYRVPADNPFVSTTTWYGSNLVPAKVRTEFYAIGLRNPWRMSFDRETGRLYCGDVGQGAREEIDIIVNGGNYGWAFREGFIAGPKPTPPGATHINPILDYGRGSGTNQGFSVTGGVVYRGSRIPALYGHYIFADYVSGNVWSTFYDGATATPFVRLFPETGIAGFGHDPASGDVLLADQNDDIIRRLVQVPIAGAPIPETLAATRIFADLATLTPEPGFVPYDVNVPFWSDDGIKTRWFYIPTNGLVTYRDVNNWSFPTGSVWVKHFELELTNGVPSSRKRLETRVLVRYQNAGQAEVYGATYRWGDSLTNATLVPDGGLDEEFAINDGGNVRTQIWHYPGRSECLTCHTRLTLGGLALGFNTPQLNRDFDYGVVVDNQIRAMDHAGYFLRAATNINSLRALARADDESVSLEQRVRSYLTANCVYCHQPGGAGLGNFDTRIFPSMTDVRLIDGTLVNNGGDPDNRVVAPGSLDHSMLLQRISTRGPGQMPPLASSVLDTEAIALVSRWITNELAGYQSFTTWQTNNFGSTNAPNALASADPDEDDANNFTEYLTFTDPNQVAEFWSTEIQETGDAVEILFPRLANRRIEVQWTTDLASPIDWQFLDVPENRPHIAATNGTSRVTDSLTNGAFRIYRARVFEP
jgi:glucose/arabinose dehydrogenase/mono/diheme cytochrome c family protein